MNDWVVLVVIFAAVFISSPLIATLHELGHAFAYLIFTKPDRIDIYIGSYGGATNNIEFNTGKLHFYIKRSFPFVKGIGLCQSHKSEINYIKHIIILLAGPLFTFFIAGFIAVVIIYADAHLLVKISCYILLGFSVLSLLTNLIPMDLSNSLYNISNTADNLETDGKQILFDLKIKRTRIDFIDALKLFDDEELESSVEKLKKVLATSPRSQKILRLIIRFSLKAKLYNDTEFYLSELESKFQLSANDLLQKGYLASISQNHDEAIEIYSKVLKMDKNNIFALNNIGYELVEKGAHKVAKHVLDRAIKLKPGFDNPYHCLGYSKILQGEYEEGKILVDKCLELNDANADAYKTLGIYHLKRKNLNLANENFNKATDLDSTIDLSPYAEELKALAENLF